MIIGGTHKPAVGGLKTPPGKAAFGTLRVDGDAPLEDLQSRLCGGTGGTGRDSGSFHGSIYHP